MTEKEITFTVEDMKQAIKLWLQVYHNELIGHFDLIIEPDKFRLLKVDPDDLIS